MEQDTKIIIGVSVGALALIGIAIVIRNKMAVTVVPQVGMCTTGLGYYSCTTGQPVPVQNSKLDPRTAGSHYSVNQVSAITSETEATHLPPMPAGCCTHNRTPITLALDKTPYAVGLQQMIAAGGIPADTSAKYITAINNKDAATIASLFWTALYQFKSSMFDRTVNTTNAANFNAAFDEIVNTADITDNIGQLTSSYTSVKPLIG